MLHSIGQSRWFHKNNEFIWIETLLLALLFCYFRRNRDFVFPNSLTRHVGDEARGSPFRDMRNKDLHLMGGYWVLRFPPPLTTGYYGRKEDEMDTIITTPHTTPPPPSPTGKKKG